MSLHDDLRAAHAAGRGLVPLYLRAAERADGDAAAFFLTHAWVHALEAGDAAAPALEARLRALGRA
ncbi:hypothetical protein JQC91_15520 [Jannaschia sp. Os4]|uniref:hypothetical protein n=1 Tax=Jannaschia sp. Os4 TaxID=2807617 RepID=UPI00193980D6|nr:hypothetical protein [Jannaschia sp. Os4]MBM2577716.1 hypothetical protein [Jannaschia sp. Os4]